MENGEVVSVNWLQKQNITTDYKRWHLRCIATWGRPTSHQSFWRLCIFGLYGLYKCCYYYYY